MPKGFSNDSTSSQLGFPYQYLIAVESCLDTEDGSVYIEKYGDISNSDQSVEVKHHFDENSKLTITHVDFWKTLRNWVVEYELICDYSALLLVTTSFIQKDSKLDRWNTISKEEKYNLINDLKENHSGTTIAPYIDKVFDFNDNYNKETLLSILNRFSLQPSTERIDEKLDSLTSKPHFASIPKGNRKQFVLDLMTHIIQQGIKDRTNWEIDIQDFHNYFQLRSRLYVSSKIPLPKIVRSRDSQVIDYDKKYVKELQRIELPSELLGQAVEDYNRSNQAMIVMIDSSYDLTEIFEEYHQVLLDDLLIHKVAYLEGAENISEPDRKSDSRKYYADCMKIPLKAIEGVGEIEDYFQRGCMQQVVDDERHVWLITISNES